jgi:hypothetical protein
VSGWRAVRRRILTPDESATRLDVRGFEAKNAQARDLLEGVGRTFLEGFGVAAGARQPDEVTAPLDALPTPLRGFGYEGAAMAFALLDALPVPGRGRLDRFLAGAGADHIYMAYVGAGWALARLPRPLHRRLAVADPLLRWLVLDGYGFHQAYFHTGRYVYGQYQQTALRWPPGGPQWYVPHVVDQGIGRALWFVYGTDPARVAGAIGRFAPGRHADLFSGAGLAATYAGGADETELRVLRDAAGKHRPALAQGSAFAAQARIRAGLQQPATATATGVFCDMTPEKAAKVTDDALPDPVGDDPVPAYERWRRAIAAQFAP